MEKMQLLETQIKNEIENGSYYRVHQLMEYHFKIEDVQSYIEEKTGEPQRMNSAGACFNSLIRFLMKGGKL
jgi:hypothetical protein